MWGFILLFFFLAFPAFGQSPSISLAGPEELFLSQDDMTCGATPSGSRGDRADVPLNAFRRKDGSVIVLSGNQNNYYLEGPSFDQARRTSCANLVRPVNDPDPAKFTARRWLFAIHAKSYDFVLGFAHHEYHGDDFFSKDCQRSSKRNFECWYGATTLVVSRDGGHSFETPSAPDNVLASLPFKFATGRKRAGATAPKVVGNPHDGMTYVMINYLDRNRDIRAGQCLLRGSAREFNDWRAWDGRAFAMDMESPYVVERSGDCAAVLPYVVSSVKYVPAIKQFVAIGLRRSNLVYSFSKDLLRWSPAQTLMEVTRVQEVRRGGTSPRTPARAYFSLLDPTSSSINFDTLEGKPYLFFVQFRNEIRYRDIYRVPITIK
jgi:hypothetical protein